MFTTNGGKTTQKIGEKKVGHKNKIAELKAFLDNSTQFYNPDNDLFSFREKMTKSNDDFRKTKK